MTSYMRDNYILYFTREKKNVTAAAGISRGMTTSLQFDMLNLFSTSVYADFRMIPSV
jgi:hypothetical protein